MGNIIVAIFFMLVLHSLSIFFVEFSKDPLDKKFAYFCILPWIFYCIFVILHMLYKTIGG